ncbi:MULTISPECIES: ribonuclease P protein component [Paenibacillus]|uniref:Ribonuclease P protein component n=1 Tax=Paenibacillus lutrae TaxID=2078573 RepID=A0A7X3FJF6_9BACL|nr:ribonuclease P protein component [Paenibacillus sp. FJAT-26967]MVP00765.1 ribonuclease P protein component [Paenibacillus lutrae]
MEKKLRLAKREDFQKVYRYGKSAANHQFVLYYLPRREQEHFRLGISASKKIGNAVIRNRLRRLIKEIVRLNMEKFPGGYDYIVIVRKPAVEMEYKEMEKSVAHVFKRAGLLRKNN